MRIAKMLKLYIGATEGMDQKRLAMETGVSETTISRFLAGERYPDAESLVAIQAWCFGREDEDSLEKRVARLEHDLAAASSVLNMARIHLNPLR